MARLLIFTTLAPFTRAGIRFADVRNPVEASLDDLTDEQFLRLLSDPALTLTTVVGEGDDEARADFPAVLKPVARDLLLRLLDGEELDRDAISAALHEAGEAAGLTAEDTAPKPVKRARPPKTKDAKPQDGAAS